MNILISNDDGVDSPGIRALAAAVRDFGNVIVVAPHRERSTASHSLTLHKPLRIQSLGGGFYSTSGSPADCIYLGVREILKKMPDVILSGINYGANLGTDVHYSGTVAASREGALLNVPSYAFSLVDLKQIRPDYPSTSMDFDMAAQIARRVLEETLEQKMPPHSLLNVNIPNMEMKDIRGLKVTRQGFRYYANEVTKRMDPRGKDYYWIGGGYLGFEKGKDCDCIALNEGWVSMTPISIDCTEQSYFDTIRKLSTENGFVSFSGKDAVR